MIWVDDDPRSVKSSRAYFEIAAECELRVLPEADEALRIFSAACNPRCLIVDLQMPTPAGVSRYSTADDDLTGLWLLDQLAESIEANETRIAVVTSFDEIAAGASVEDVVPSLRRYIRVFTKDKFFAGGSEVLDYVVAER